MLVIISDLHLTDGTGGATVSTAAFELFAERLRDLAQAASWRTDGRYRPLERIELLLLGDILDLVGSMRWLTAPRLRPWGNLQSPAAASFLTSLAADIVRHNSAGLEVLRNLAVESAVSVAAATGHGQPDAGHTQPVPVRIHYLAGNHDWFLHLADVAYDPLRDTVARGLGLRQPADRPFAHDPAESPELIEVLRQHRVLARHGDVFDTFSYSGQRDASSLADAVVIELLLRFVAQLTDSLGDALPPATAAGLAELDSLRPILLAPVWLEGLLERTCPRASLRAEIKRVWDHAVDGFLAIDFVREQQAQRGAAELESLLKFSRRLSVGRAEAILQWLERLRGSADSTMHRHALAEPEFRSRRAKHIVYGHTHVAASVPLEASYVDAHVLNQVYFNAGTWRRVHRRTQFTAVEHEFIAADSLTFLAFFKQDERGGRPYETWTGSLGIPPATVALQRLDRGLDQGTTTHADRTSVSAPTVPLVGPHFAASPHRARRADVLP